MAHHSFGVVLVRNIRGFLVYLQVKENGPKSLDNEFGDSFLAMLETDRLILRRWQKADRAPFALLNADPRVMEFMPAILSVEESDRLINRIEQHFDRYGFGLCAVELRRDHSFIGFVGLSTPSFKAAFTPCIEIGWRLSADHWGHGLAIEGAQSIVRNAFEVQGIEDLVSFTVPKNLRSRRVMENLGMTWSPKEDFDHPNLPEGHPLRRHVLYRLRFQSGDRT